MSEILDERPIQKNENKQTILYVLYGIILFCTLDSVVSILSSLHEFQPYFDTPILVHFWAVTVFKLLIAILIANYSIEGIVKKHVLLFNPDIIRTLLIFAILFLIEWFLGEYSQELFDDGQGGYYKYWGEVSTHADINRVRAISLAVFVSVITLLVVQKTKSSKGKSKLNNIR